MWYATGWICHLPHPRAPLSRNGRRITCAAQQQQQPVPLSYLTIPQQCPRSRALDLSHSTKLHASCIGRLPSVPHLLTRFSVTRASPALFLASSPCPLTCHTYSHLLPAFFRTTSCSLSRRRLDAVLRDSQPTNHRLLVVDKRPVVTISVVCLSSQLPSWSSGRAEPMLENHPYSRDVSRYHRDYRPVVRSPTQQHQSNRAYDERHQHYPSQPVATGSKVPSHAQAPASRHQQDTQSDRHTSAHKAERTEHSTLTLSTRSPWLVLPSVSSALNLFGDARRQCPRFSLVIRQQPRRGLAIGNSQMSLRTARSVPLDPPPVCELLIDRNGEEQLLALPEVFVRAQLVPAENPAEECLPDARRNDPLVGDTLQSPFNSRIDTREDQSFFVFKELGVRSRGLYRLRFDLFDRVGLQISRVASVYTDAFEVLERRKHPGLTASSGLMDALVDRGMKYKLRKAADKQGIKKRKSPEEFYYNDERMSTARRQSYAGDYDQTAYLAERRFNESYSRPQHSTHHYSEHLLPSRSPPQFAAPDARRTAFEIRRETRDRLPPLDSLPPVSSSGSAFHSASRVDWNGTSRYVQPLPRRSPPQFPDAWSPEMTSPSSAANQSRPTLPSLSRLHESREQTDPTGLRDEKRARIFHHPHHESAPPATTAPVSPGRGLGLNYTSPSDSNANGSSTLSYTQSCRRQSAFEDPFRPRLEFRSSSSSLSTSTSRGASTSTGTSQSDTSPAQIGSPPAGRIGDQSQTQKPTLPPISSLYSPPSPRHLVEPARSASTSPPRHHREW